MCPLYVSGLIGQRWFHFLTQNDWQYHNEEAETGFG